MADSDRSLLERATLFLKEHNSAFVFALFAYGLLVFPWLRAQGFYEVGIVVGVLFLGAMVLALRANVERAKERLRGDEEHERRGF